MSNELLKDALILEGVYESQHIMQGMKTFVMVLINKDGGRMFSIVGCKPNHTDYVIKAFKRILAIKPPDQTKEEPKDGSEAISPSDTPSELSTRDHSGCDEG